MAYEGRDVIRDENQKLDYYLGKVLGTGGFGKCYHATRLSDNAQFACKVIARQKLGKRSNKKQLKNEVNIHKQVKHPGIAEFKHVFEVKESKLIVFLLEYCPNRTLYDMLKRRRRLIEIEVQTLLRSILEVLSYLHNLKIIHRDIKAANICLDKDMRPKLIDFGLSARIQFQGNKRNTHLGTIHYLAPELVLTEGHSYPVDIWAFGVLMYLMLFGKPPFEGTEMSQIQQKIKNVAYSFPEHVLVSSKAKDLLTRIFVKDTSKRITLQEIKASEFFNPGYELPPHLELNSLKGLPSEEFLARYLPNATKNESICKLYRDPLAFLKNQLRPNLYQNDQILDTAEEKTSPIHMIPAKDLTVRHFRTHPRQGTCYLLSNGIVGMLFNDLANIQFCPVKKSFSLFMDNGEIYRGMVEDYRKLPTQVKKRVLVGIHLKQVVIQHSSYSQIHKCELIEDYEVRMTSFESNEQVSCLLLTNGWSQFFFKDTTQLAVKSETQEGVYKDAEGKRHEFNCRDQDGINRRTDIACRFKLAKETISGK